MYDVIMNTDPLAKIALGGLVTVILVTLILFIYVMTRSDPKDPTTKA
ncbi:MAG: hypothetical protein K0U74_13240 [Alphaproteobacteria bacterium]|nr:hypothetical protein [Alphaproteobacteria bacterium]